MPIDPFSSVAGLLTIIQMTVVASEQAKSHKHNVAALARRIKMLVPLLEEVKEREMTEAQMSNFEDLQLAIERARDLIVKCGERSKMYMMFRGTGVIERFKDVSLDLDRCLNALPLVNLKVSEGIRQQVDSVSTQLRKAKYTIDEMDQKLSTDIALVLKEQREGLEANQALMRQLAEKLELTSHDKVLAETRALEIEKEEVRAEKNRQEEAYISQIINLLSVMDANQDAGPSSTQREPEARPSLVMKVPPVAPQEFKCPLSLELMADPVVIASGQTFEREYIRRWWSQGHRTCPITNLPLSNLELISNFSLKRMISDWCEAHNQPQPTPPVLSPPHSPTSRLIYEGNAFGKPAEEDAHKPGPVDQSEEKGSRSGPMTVPDRGKEAEDGGKGKGKRVVTLADLEGHKPGFEHLRPAPAVIAHEQHVPLPSEFGRVAIHDEDVVTGEVTPGHANPLPSPSGSAQKPLSRRTIHRTFLPSSDAVRASVSGAEWSAEDGVHGREPSGEASKPPKPASKGDASDSGHRRNSSAPLSELTSGEATRLMNLQAQAKAHGDHRATLSSPPQKRSAHTPPRGSSAHTPPIASQVAAAHAQPSGGEETEDLSQFKFAPPPPLGSSLPRPSSTSNIERNLGYSHSLPTKGGLSGREEGGHAAALDHAPPRFAPPSPIHSEVPVGVTSSGHVVRQDSIIPAHHRAPSADLREPLADPKRPVTPSELQSMARELKSGKPDLIRAAAGDLRQLAKFSMDNRKAIAAAGVIPDLIGLLLSKDLKTQENAVTALLNLSIHDGNKAIIARDGAIPRLVEVLQEGSQEAKENAAATLFSLSVLEECKQQIGVQPGAILGLVGLLRTGSPLGKKDATTALFNLSICHENKSRIVRNGAVGPLIQLIRDPTLQEKVVAVLANLTTVGEGRLAITEACGIKALAKVTEGGTPRSRENAAAALLQLCINSSRHTAEVYQEGVVPALMTLQQTGTPRAKEKARSLLRHFRDNLQDTVKS